jgi:uncharacterized membrane protein YgcG
MNPGISDSTGSLSSGDLAKLRRKIGNIQLRFPQVVLQIVIRPMPTDHPFSLYAFWLFNAGAFAGEGRRGKNNHAILLLVDPARKECAIMPGYGLEELLSQEALGHLLDLASPVWDANLWAEGIERVLDGLDKLLASVAIPEESATVHGEY